MPGHHHSGKRMELRRKKLSLACPKKLNQNHPTNTYIKHIYKAVLPHKMADAVETIDMQVRGDGVMAAPAPVG